MIPFINYNEQKDLVDEFGTVRITLNLFIYCYLHNFRIWVGNLIIYYSRI